MKNPTLDELKVAEKAAELELFELTAYVHEDLLEKDVRMRAMHLKSFILKMRECYYSGAAAKYKELQG